MPVETLPPPVTERPPEPEPPAQLVEDAVRRLVPEPDVRDLVLLAGVER